MIFESNDFAFSILNVVRIDQENVRKINIGRDFDALSFRFSADTDLTTENCEYKKQRNSSARAIIR